MKRTFFLSFLWLLFACDDGDLQIEQVDFDAVNISTCGNFDEPTETTFFFKIDGDEALLLNLASGLLKNETSTTGTLTSVIPSPSNLIYRLFSDNVSQAYFCDAIPPLEPTVSKENTATAGDISINTKVSSATTTIKNYAHTISITGLSLTNDQGESITDSSTFEYGDFTTTTDNSVQLETPFSNYAAIDAFTVCTNAPSDGSIRLQKLINDEFIALDIPIDSLANMATVDTIPRKVSLETGLFKYIVLDTLVSEEMPCAYPTLSEEIQSWRYHSTAGNLSIETVENAPDAEGKLSYTHNFTLENIVLTLLGDDESVEDAALNPIENIPMGSYITSVD